MMIYDDKYVFFLVILCSFMIQRSYLSSLLPRNPTKTPGVNDDSLAATGFWQAGDASLFADNSF